MASIRFRLLVICMMFGFGGVLPLRAAPKLKVGLVLDKGGKDDKSFNTAAFVGMEKAGKDLSVETKYVESTDDNAFEPLLRSFAKKDYDLIVAIGFSQAEAIRKIAAQFPQKKFAIVDAEVKLPNVRSLMFEEHQGSYLAGALAALKSKNGKVGFIGGMDIPLIRRFLLGYEAGAKAITPNIKIVTNFVGITGDAWNNPPKAKELALAQYQAGTDVIYLAAGASNMGAFDAAEEKKALAIGCDSNQNRIKPGFVLTSMVKRVDVAVYQTIKDTTENKFTAGTVRFGLQNDGVDLAYDDNNAKLVDPKQKAKIAQLKKDIIDGKIKVPDYYETKR
ncbi:MAG: BMP family ABC transporter substrate-binding protein [Chitinophagaceae bacterium]|nr:BMP family ABC transporter substrate-binding protein [Oligoflexus sp.]